MGIVWITRCLQQKLATKKLKLGKSLPTSLLTVEDLMMLIALKGENAIKKMRDNVENILCEKVEKQNSHLQLDDNLTKSNTTGKQYS